MTDYDKVKQAFIDADINSKLHFTKLGYYKLYGSSRYLWAFVLSTISTIIFIACFILLVRIVNTEGAALVERLFLMAFIGTCCSTLSDFVYGDTGAAIKWLLITVVLGFAKFYFL